MNLFEVIFDISLSVISIAFCSQVFLLKKKPYNCAAHILEQTLKVVWRLLASCNQPNEELLMQ